MLEDRHPALLLLDGKGRIKEVGGDLDKYDLNEATIGASAESQVLWLVGLLPPDGAELQLHHVLCGDSVAADVILRRRGDETEVLLLSADSEGRPIAWRQENNLAQFLADAPSAVLGGGSFDPAGADWQAGVAVARLLESDQDALDPQYLQQRLNQAQAVLASAFAGEAGAVEVRGVGVAVGVFREADELGAACCRAVRAAEQARRTLNAAGLPAATGLACGPVTVASVRTPAGGQFVAYGPAVRRAERLAALAGQGEIVLDQSVVENLSASQRGICAPIQPETADQIPFFRLATAP